MHIRSTYVLILFAVVLLAACGGSRSTPQRATPTATPEPPSASPQAGSFVAFCPAIHVRFMAPPAVMQSANTCQDNSLFLTTNIVSDAGVEYLTVFRYASDARGQSAAGWKDVLAGFHRTDTASGDVAWSEDDQPVPQAAPGSAGFIGHFTRTDKGGTRYAGALWTGAAGSDTVAILGQASAAQRAQLDRDMAQILRTADFNAQ
jgi:hypothetical protein